MFFTTKRRHAILQGDGISVVSSSDLALGGGGVGRGRALPARLPLPRGGRAGSARPVPPPPARSARRAARTGWRTACAGRCAPSKPHAPPAGAPPARGCLG